MRYDWEDKITQDMIRQMQDILPDGFMLCGVAVGYPFAVEGALIVAETTEPSGIFAADVWKDIDGDAQRIYGEAVENLFPE